MIKIWQLFSYNKVILFILIYGFIFNYLDLYATESSSRVYDEYETVAGDIIGIGGTGASVSSQVSSIRINPAGVNVGKIYSIEGSYNKPSFGGDFYQLGVIDNKTSVLGAGFLYSDFKDSVYERREEGKDDSPVKRRFYLALSMGNETVSFGIMSNYTEAIDDSEIDTEGKKVYERKKGFTFFSPGVLLNLGPQFKLGLSVENIFNHSLRQYNPRFYRLGCSYHYASEIFKLAVNLDYRGRERIDKEKEYDSSLKNMENMVFLGVSTTLYDIVKLMAGYGQEISGNNRNSLSYGVSLMKDNSSLSFGSLYPYFKDFKKFHMGFNLTYAVVI